jgi:hypothetical protein
MKKKIHNIKNKYAAIYFHQEKPAQVQVKINKFNA